MELERQRAVVRMKMSYVLTESLYRKSPLWQPLKFERVDHGGQSRQHVYQGRLVTLKTFHCVSFLDRNFNVVDNERLRWQDGSFGPFYERWRRLIVPGRHPHSLEPLMRLAAELKACRDNPHNAAALHVTKLASGEDLTAPTRKELLKFLDLDEAIETYKQYLAHFQPWITERSVRLAAEEAERAQADLAAEEAHRQRFASVMAPARGL